MISGIVTKGLGLAGNTYGVPTANISLITPAELAPGTYAGYARFGSQCFPAMMYYGAHAPLKLEVHLLNFSGNLYGVRLSAEPRAKVANEAAWISTETMKTKIADDLQRVRTWFATHRDQMIA
jgi:riboflavin kinase/FMN adenylyltransferase